MSSDKMATELDRELNKIRREKERALRMESDDSSDLPSEDDQEDVAEVSESNHDSNDELVNDASEGIEEEEIGEDGDANVRGLLDHGQFQRDSLQTLKASTKAVNAMRKTAHSLQKTLKRKRSDDEPRTLTGKKGLPIEEPDTGKEAHPNPLAFVIGESSNIDRDSEGATAQQILRRSDIARFCEGINKQTFPLRRIVKQNALVKFALSDMEKKLKKSGLTEDVETLSKLLGISDEVSLSRLVKVHTIFNEGLEQLQPIKASLTHEQQLVFAINKKTTSTAVTDYIKRYEGNAIFSDRAARRAAEIEKLERREEQERSREKKHLDTRPMRGRGRGRDYYSEDRRGRFPNQSLGFHPNMAAGVNPGPYFMGSAGPRQGNSGFMSHGFDGGFGGGLGLGSRGSAKSCYKCHGAFAPGHQCPLISKP